MNHPDRLGKYQITEVLGQGAMGVVYKGYDPDIKRVVALKTIRRQFDDGSESGATIAARFRNEAQAAGRLLHPGIVGVYDFGEDQSVAFIAMEYVEGNTLAHYLTSRIRFTDEDILSLIGQLLEALHHAHERGVWHRDIKPANLIVTRAGKLKVADFGIARVDAAGLTQANSVIGTPMYMAPEQFIGAQIDHRVDIYAAGVVLYQLIAGRAPFIGSPEALMYKVVHEVAPPPSLIEDANRSDRFDAIVSTAMSKQPDKRFASAEAFRTAIIAAAAMPLSPTVSDETIIKLPLRPAGLAVVGAPSTAGSVTHWEKSVLAQAEHSLARHVGPLASVLVRRAAKECHDLPSLYAKLAEQVTNPAARSAFINLGASRGATGGGSTPTTFGRTAFGSTGGSGGRTFGTMGSGSLATVAADAVRLSDPALEQAQKLLAAHVGPIAKVIVRKAAEKTRYREPFFSLLADSVSDPAARQKLLAELAKLV
ncbi:serine/threonine protein kinase [Aquincola sp. S2]|uniref:Serine/threonine protein kinase n=1 Tax=Pseudaquabacterium terrae TaxID=2732868 RepID=A0ABX2EHM1_9BURK|nr:serine/threonine protein kinase [Aquabacterium terrae]